jgi:hypothetical protein
MPLEGLRTCAGLSASSAVSLTLFIVRSCCGLLDAYRVS